MYYTVYRTTNKVNGKIYIGCHKTNNLDDGYIGSGKLLGRAIEKYGIENFEKEILAVFDKSSDMFDMESELVNEDFVERDDTYNIKEGGHGGFDWINKHKTREQKTYSAKRGREAANKKDAHILGTRKHQELLQTDAEYFNRHKAALSAGMQRYYKDGGTNPMQGKTHSRATRTKMSHKASGQNNSQYGTMWIYNTSLKESKKISVNEPIPEGWVKGRKLKF